MGAVNSGDKSPAVQTHCVGRAAPNFAPAFGLRVLKHRFVPHGHEVTSWIAAIFISELGFNREQRKQP
jgi:hypothetical protein